MANISKKEKAERARNSQGANGKKILPKKDVVDIDAIEEAMDGHTEFRTKLEQTITPNEPDNSHKFEPPVEDVSTPQNNQQDIGNVEFEDISNVDSDADDIDFVPSDKDPMLEDVIVNDYMNVTNHSATTTAIPVERVIPQPVVNPMPIDALYDKDKDEKKEESKKKVDKEPATKINPTLDDLSPSQRRKNAETDADAFIETYAQFMPVLPKKMAKFNMSKLEKLEMKGEISLNMQIMEDGTTIKQHCQAVNDRADGLYVVTSDMKKAIKEPLVEVLLEKGIAMTPIQRLTKVVLEQVFQFGVAGFQMLMENRDAIKQFKEFRQQADKANSGNNNSQQQHQTVYAEQPVVHEQKEERRHEEAKVVNISTENKPTTMNMNDVLTEENGGITIEEIVPDAE